MVHLYHFSRFHTYALIYDSFRFLTSASMATPEDGRVDTMKGRWWKGRVGRIGRSGLTPCTTMCKRARGKLPYGMGSSAGWSVTT